MCHFLCVQKLAPIPTIASLIKVVWFVFRVKDMHFGSPSDPSQTAAAEAKPRYVYSILKPHGQSFRGQVRLLLSEAKPS